MMARARAPEVASPSRTEVTWVQRFCAATIPEANDTSASTAFPMNSLPEKPELPLSSAILRKRIFAALALLLMVLMFTIHNYHRSTYLRSAVDWRWFWIGEAFIAVWLVFVVVQFLRKRLRKGP